ncbi:unnamed protein product [Sphagnum balticum]
MEPVDHSAPTFLPFTAFLPVQFWHELAKKKLEEYKLDDSTRHSFATYKINNYKDSNKATLNFDTFSLQSSSPQLNSSGPVSLLVPGSLKNFNTIEGFNSFNKEALTHDVVSKLYDQWVEILKAPDKSTEFLDLNNFILLTFADLKTHFFKYTFFSPAFCLKGLRQSQKEALSQYLTKLKIEGFDSALKDFISHHINKPFPSIFFLQKHADSNTLTLHSSIKDYLDSLCKNDANTHACLIDSYNQEDKYGPNIHNFIAFLTLFREHSSNQASSPLSQVKLLILKDFLVVAKDAKITLNKSLVLTLDLSKSTLLKKDPNDRYPEVSGTESFSNVKSVDLRSQLDEKSLASSAVDLNIKLMKWRLLPELNINKVQNLKCLLFGAGTLGCQIARVLMGWGVRTITFVDYGKVSHSNPVRQTLYDFEDATSGGKPKAEAAAEKLKKIFPDMNSKGVSLEIPMPGHFANSQEKKEQVLQSLNVLEELAKEHDALFLLTDNRESRWLPTVLANKYNKICLTVALGFDSFVVIRHGLPPNVHNAEEHGERLGCYFCNDIVSPGNSMKDRTLDQMCTVTRPGLSFISSAYAAELLISLAHHPMGNAAPAYDDEKKNNQETPLGIIPQHIRGNLSDFETKIYYSRGFPNCVACSEYVLQEYSNNRDEFMLRIMNDPDYLQTVTKISTLLEEADKDECFSLGSEEDAFEKVGDFKKA